MKNQFSISEIADMYGHPESTTKKHIAKLKKQNLFQKSALGKYYNQADVTNLSILLHFPALLVPKKAG